MEYVYQIQYLDSYPTYANFENVVCNVVYQLHGHSGSYMNTITAEQEIIVNVSSPTFIPFEQLTKEQVIEWVVLAAGDSKINSMKAEIENSIINSMKPESVRLSPLFPN